MPVSDEDSEESDRERNSSVHKRTASMATSGSHGRKSISTWATNAVGNLRKKEKNSNFEALDNDDDLSSVERSSRKSPNANRAISLPPSRPRSRSPISKHTSPKTTPRRLKSTDRLRETKTMRALYTFSGGTDELSMEIGDEISVIAEPSTTWWLGECQGRKGLFPVSYTEELPRRPPLPTRPHTLSSKQSQPPSPIHDVIIIRSRSNSENVLESGDIDEPFGDHHSALSPIAHSPQFRDQMTSEDDDDKRGLFVQGSSNGDGQRSSKSPPTSPPSVVRQLTRSFSAKKAPPPPPPTRKTTSASLGRTRSTSASTANANTSSSPFLSPSTPNSKRKNDLFANESKSPFDGDGEDIQDGFVLSPCPQCSCNDFRQNVFKSEGFCNSCFHAHI